MMTISHSRLVGAGVALFCLTITAGLCAEAPDSPAQPGDLTEVVVTAQKRTENVQKVSAAISVLSESMLQSSGVTDIRKVESLVPGVRFGKQQSVAQLFIRGVGIGSDNPNLDTAVAMVVNGVNQPREGTGASLYDIQRIEVLKGPQGTIYGTNAIGGVVNVVPVRPGHDWDGSVYTELGNYSLVHVTATQDIPVGDALRLRAAVNRVDRSGYASNGLDDENSLAGRLTAVMDSWDTLSIMLWGSGYQNLGRGDQGYATPPRNAEDPWQVGPITTSSPRNGESRHNTIGEAGAEVNWQINDNLNFTYVPGWYHSAQSGHLLIDTGTPVGSLQSVFNTRNQITQELRLGSGGIGRFQWLTGLYYSRLDTAEYREFFAGGAQLRNYNLPQVLGTSYAAFAQGTYSILDDTRLVLGARLARDQKSGHGNVYGPPPAYLVTPSREFSADYTWNHVEWKASVEHDLSASSLIYVAAQTGFLGGAFQNFPDGLNGQSNKVSPEKLLAFTVGSKNEFADGRIRLNAEGFYYDYKDYQVGLINLAAGTNAFFNAPKSRIYGLDLESNFQFTSNDRLTLNFSTMNAKFTDFYVAQGVSSAARAYNFTGYDLPHAPKFEANATLEHTFHLSNGARLVPNLTSQYSVGHWGNFSHGITRCAAVPVGVLSQDACVDYGLRQGAYTMSSGNLTYISPKDFFSAGLWVRNIENKAALTSGGDAANPNVRTATTWNPPRTYGVDARVRW
jgi:iron complex outermembrane receptor protein